MRENRGRAARGSAVVELALTMPLLLVLFAGAADFARVFYTANVLTNAARAGAQFGTTTPGAYTDHAGMETAGQSVANANLVGTPAVLSASHICECFNDTGSNLGVSADCATCNAGHLVVHVTVSATQTFSRILPAVSVLPPTLTVSRSTTMRAQ